MCSVLVRSFSNEWLPEALACAEPHLPWTLFIVSHKASTSTISDDFLLVVLSLGYTMRRMTAT
jgi:hypothetical protein